jgi:cytochrome c peroxidase
LKILLFLLITLLACQKKQENVSSSKKDSSVSEEQLERDLLQSAKEVFVPLPTSLIDTEINKDLIHLGKTLYFEKSLSKSGTISCNSCHKLDQFGVDNEATSLGHDGRRGGRNSPTVYNAALNFVQFWDGRAKDLEEQALGPLLNPIEHGLANEAEALKKLDTKSYRDLFSKAFTKGGEESFSFKNIGLAIAAFEKTLLTPSRFDDYLNGQAEALSKIERQGLRKFIEVGCTTCHQGVGVGGDSFQMLGQVNKFETKDEGRFLITNDPQDKFVFKVPSLRNASKTAPYFHDGSIKTLEEAIKLMGHHQLDVALDAAEIEQLKAFIGSLEAKSLPQITL